MRAVVYSEFGGLPLVRDVPEPSCPPDGVVVDVAATGVCRSDWHAWSGHDPDVVLPHVPGHEFAGTVAAVGARVGGGWAVGDRVTAPFVCACGDCAMCARGEHQVCLHQQQPGFSYWGSFAEQVVVPHAATNLVAVPDAIDLVTAAALGCRFATAHRAVTRHAEVAAGDRLAVFGCGGVGLSAIVVAVARGAEVTAVDPSPQARDMAARLGAVRVLDAAAGPVTGMDAALDAVGSADTAAAAVRSLRPRGVHVQVGLMVGADATAPMPMAEIVAGELRVVGSHGMSAADYPAMLADITAGVLDPAALVARRIGLDEAPAALTSGRPGPWGLTVVTL